MNYLYYGITLILILGAAYTSYRIGIREGAESLLSFLEEARVINIDDKDNITPNCKK